MTLKRMLAFVVAMAMVMGIVPAMVVTAANDDAAAVAVVANEEYDTLQDAIAAAEAAYDNDGAMATVTLLDSTDEDFTLEYGIVKLVTDGFKYTGTATVTGAVLMSDCYLTNVEAELTGVSSDKSMFGYTSMDTGVEVVEGAQVRIGDGADEDGMVTDSNGGLRFIATTKMIDTLAAMAYELYNTESGEYAEGYELGIRLMAESSSSEVFVPATLWQQEGKVFTAALTNLKESNYNRRYTANAYVVIEGVRFDDKATSTRSIYQVSAGLLAQNAEQSAMSQDLVDVLNAYVNQTGVRLVLSDFTTEATLTAATGNVNGAYTGEAVFKVGSTTYKNGVYTVVLEAIGRSVINTKLFNQYVRINNNNSKVAPLTTITDNGNGTYTITFDYADMNKTAGVITEPVTLENGEIVAYIPAGVTFNGSATRLKLLLTAIDDEQSEVEAEEGEDLNAFDIHVSGIDENNTTPIIVTLPEVAEKGLNRGNLKLYHVEDGKQVMMEQVDSVEMLTKHNQFTYDPLDGTVTVALASFSEVALVADTEKAWNGKFDYTWYDASKTELTIANADQLAAFGQIVGGMNGQTQDSFKGKTVKLVSDINLGDDEENNEADKIFYPIGYYNNLKSYEKESGVSVTSDINPFEGTFDGNGHTIKNFYQNTWEMFGDYNSGYSDTPNHYDDGMGLFGYVVGGTVKNLTVDNFSSDGEFTPTGVIAAYAVNSTFENIALTNCNPRVYNTGNGGIVGIGGNSDDPDEYKLTFTNITIDNTNKISALWGSWDVACGGLVGMFRGAGRADMTNCHVAAQMDVYNDVCGNYQYYWYRYAGMMIGTNKNMITDKDGYTVPETSKFHAKDCTVHFGDWNDYWYCEFVANSLASYTHDHQFSRLEQVDSVDVADMKVTTTVNGEQLVTDIPTSGRYNYVVVTVDADTSTVNASCYHFVNGDVWNHEQGGYETTDINGDGVVDSNVLKEDKQHVYLPFNQLFTGYGWGVKHIPVGEFDGITILDREVADSVEKFEAKDVAKITTNTTVEIGDLFAAKTLGTDDPELKPENVQVTVSPVPDTGSTVSATYTPDATDWTKGTLTFTGTGAATITITDYYFCTPTTIEVMVEDYPNVDKFVAKAENATFNKNIVTLGELFTAKAGVTIDSANVVVTTAGIDATWAANTTDWTQGTITVTGEGELKVTITDQDYCKDATTTVSFAKAEKFAHVFPNTDDYLYRVGNHETTPVALSSLFEANGNAEIGTVSVKVDTIEGTASGKPTDNTSLTSGKIQFSGTGVVKVTIQDNYCIPTDLYLEVVNAKNATTAASATANNVVLLNNTNGGFSVSTGYGFYGNGFTVTLDPNSHSTKRGAGFDGYIHMNGGIIDNLKVEGPVYPEANIYRSQGETGTDADDPVNYFRNGVIIESGDATISNSYISGARTAIYVKNGEDVVIENTTVSGGAYANIEVSVSKSLRLENVSTVQKETKDSYGQNKNMVGTGIVVDNADTKLILQGVTQYNWMTQTQWENMIGDEYKSQFPKLFTDNKYEKLWHYKTDDRIKLVNTGIIYACTVTEPNIEGEIEGYDTTEITLGGNNGVVYTVVNNNSDSTLDDNEISAPDYASNSQNEIPPMPTFDYKNKNYEQYEDGKENYCYYDAGKVKIGFIKGEQKIWDPMILSVKKGDEIINEYTVTFDDRDYTDKPITFTEEGNYQVVYTFKDPYNYKIDANGEIVCYYVEYQEVVNITVNVAEETAQNAEFKLGDDNKDVEKIQVGDKTYLSAVGVDASTLTSSGTIKFPKSDGDTSTISFKYNPDKTWGSATISGHTFYFPIVSMGTTDGTFKHTGSWYGCFPVFDKVVEITDYADGGTGSPVTYNSLTTTLPENMKALYPQTVFRYQGTQSKVPTTPSKMTKGIYNGKLCYTTQTDLSASNERGEEWDLATYTYTDNKGATYYWYVGYYCAASTNGGCFTPDTLITLADGSQKEIQDITAEEQILAWDMFTGEYAAKDIAILVNHGEDLYEVTHLTFSDGAELKLIADHGVFDYDLNKFVYITADNYEDYIGHRFVKQNLNGGYDIVTLESGYVTEEVTSAYSITSAGTSNAFAEGMLTVAPPADFYNWIEMGDKLRYDVEQFNADVEKYGLYTYEDFKDYVTYEQFIDWNGAYLKVPVEKGIFTFEYILELIELYKGYMPE